MTSACLRGGGFRLPWPLLQIFFSPTLTSFPPKMRLSRAPHVSMKPLGALGLKTVLWQGQRSDGWDVLEGQRGKYFHATFSGPFD